MNTMAIPIGSGKSGSTPTAANFSATNLTYGGGVLNSSGFLSPTSLPIIPVSSLVNILDFNGSLRKNILPYLKSTDL